MVKQDNQGFFNQDKGPSINDVMPEGEGGRVRVCMRRHLKIIPFPVDRPGEILLWVHPAAFFFPFLRKITVHIRTKTAASIGGATAAIRRCDGHY